MRRLLETERLIIQEPRESDFPEFWRLINDPIAMRYTAGTTTLSKDKALEGYKRRIELFGHNPTYIFSIIEKSSRTYIGYCGIRYWDVIEGVELLYGYNQEHWGKGYGSEAALAVADFAFNDLAMTELFGIVYPANKASEKILQKVGFKYIKDVEIPEHGTARKYLLKP